MTTKIQKEKTNQAKIMTFLDLWKEQGFSNEEAFKFLAIEEILSEFSLSKEQVLTAGRIDRSNDRGIDAWHLERTDDGIVLDLFQVKDTVLAEGDLDKLVSGFVGLFPPEKSNLGFRQAHIDLREEASRLFRKVLSDPGTNLEVRFHAVTSKIASSAVRAKAENFPGDILIEGRTIVASLTVHDIIDLTRSFGGEEPTPIPFSVEVDASRFLQIDRPYRSCIVVVQGQEIANLYQDYGVSLFKRNPRYYQSSRNAVNRMMLNTLNDPMGRENFFIFNNGITSTCDSMAVERIGDPLRPTKPQKVRLTCSNFLVVNGAQSTVTLNKAAADLSNVEVMLRITEANENIGHTVARFTNAQTRLRPQDFRSSDDIHRRLKREFVTLQPAWFYENKRGEWSTYFNTTQDRKTFSNDNRYGTRKFGMKDISQTGLSFLGDPGVASDSPASIFNSANLYSRVFPEGVTGHQLLLPYLIFLECGNYLSERDDEERLAWASYLKFRQTYVIGRLLWSLKTTPKDLPDNVEYFSRDESIELLRSISDWCPILVEESYSRLKTAVENRAEAAGLTPRQVVRKKDWLKSAYLDIEWDTLKRLETEWEIATSMGESPKKVGLRKSLPFYVGKLH